MPRICCHFANLEVLPDFLFFSVTDPEKPGVYAWRVRGSRTAVGCVYSWKKDLPQGQDQPAHQVCVGIRAKVLQNAFVWPCPLCFCFCFPQEPKVGRGPKAGKERGT